MDVAIGLGASLGDRRRTLERTLVKLDANAHIELVRVSRWYRSPPMRGGAARGWFLNGVARLQTDLAPEALLAVCQGLELAAGRRRALHWADRPLDLDLLYVDGVSCATRALTLPHPGIAARAFVYWPLREAWPEVAASIAPQVPADGIVAIGTFACGPRPAYVAVPPAASELL